MKRIEAPWRAFDALLVANRGEIARRVLHSARALGLRTIAVHARSERDAPHVAEADEAIELQAASDLGAYLSIDAIVDACRRSGAGAVHPGYGFLSESAAFARACAAAGIVFVGPSADAIEALGDKARAKAIAQRIGVPCLPGYGGDDQSAAAMAAEAERIGAPLMIKAAAGGGGRGMRRVDSLADFERLRAAAAAEAKAAFGDDRLLLERRVDSARHVEVQVLADRFGNCVHLGERDCSTQRRHQKLVEEAPAPGVSTRTREAMGEAAVRLARAAGYVGAGTAEFLLDPDGDFHFLEVNTRLQVEHRVTEAITGIDLVEMQLRVARGESLPFAQADVRFDGHAIEARLCAEDAFAGFVPRSGSIVAWRVEHAEGVLVDHALGARVSPHFDSLLAKFVTHGRNREEARLRLVATLEGSSILGVATNREFLLECLRAPRFVAADLDVGWLVEAAAAWRRPVSDARWQAVASALWVHRAMGTHGALANWSSSGPRHSQVALAMEGGIDAVPVAEPIDDEATTSAPEASRWRASLEDAHDDGFLVLVGSRRFLLRIETPGWVSIDRHRQPIHVAFEGPSRAPTRMWLDHAGFAAGVVDAASLPSRQTGRDAGGELHANMHGRIASIAVAEGHRVNAGQPLLSIEAMKMEHVVSAPIDGRVAALAVSIGTQVSPATLLVRIEAEAA
ncbi:MAG: ATP-grasp domain-containing protein [Burkholderiaceae bacterium]|nr:ATP-grasp domain-containing protein [Burkholderiaceae bacterium]